MRLAAALEQCSAQELLGVYQLGMQASVLLRDGLRVGQPAPAAEPPAPAPSHADEPEAAAAAPPSSPWRRTRSPFADPSWRLRSVALDDPLTAAHASSSSSHSLRPLPPGATWEGVLPTEPPASVASGGVGAGTAVLSPPSTAVQRSGSSTRAAGRFPWLEPDASPPGSGHGGNSSSESDDDSEAEDSHTSSLLASVLQALMKKAHERVAAAFGADRTTGGSCTRLADGRPLPMPRSEHGWQAVLEDRGKVWRLTVGGGQLAVAADPTA